MRKKIKPAATEEEKAKPAKAIKGKPPGPPKEKEQVTIRLDKVVMNRLYAQIEHTKLRITDAWERAAVLYLEEQGQELPLESMQVRFLFPNTTRAEQRMLLQFFVFMRMDQTGQLDPYHAAWRNSFLNYLKMLEQWHDLWANTLALYSHPEGPPKTKP